MKTASVDATTKNPTVFRSRFHVDRYIREVFDDQLGDLQEMDDKFLIGYTLVFLGLATFEGARTEENDIVTVHRRFKSTKTLQLLMDRKGLFIPFSKED